MIPPRFETICIHHAEDRERHEGAAAPPIYQASTFTYPNCAEFESRERPDTARYDYTRTDNPTTRLLTEKIVALEGGEAGRAFSSGMAAISAAILSCVRAGDHVVCIDTVYGPTRQLMLHWLPRFGIETTFVPGTDATDFERAIRPNTRILYVESPSSLVYAIQDLAAVADLARSRGLFTICDNSYATPFFQRPLSLGIDLVAHTATKYFGGHSDLVAGVVVGSKARMEPLIEHEGKLLGGVIDPFAAWLMLRGLRTLALRMERHQASALAIARMLQAHPRVERVLHPGLPHHPGIELARRQMTGTSSLLSFTLKATHDVANTSRAAESAGPDASPPDGRKAAAHRVVDMLRYFSIGVSWGGHESLAIPVFLREPGATAGEWGIRLHVGLEHVDDLIADLRQALDGV
ncbi:MAG: PLP-dependent transferase [Phycisphaerae bacterium]|nr:PLP-dependent aspartate aminotransferase family protein [Phycisphaerae bacterium]NUQ44590.1 PLP-dependent transferase [Phycisphaerae bacterium]